jgi:hypothetical protein
MSPIDTIFAAFWEAIADSSAAFASASVCEAA